MIDAVVIGGGPAGLMAAESLARAGQRVLVAEARPSVGRKLLMAGKSGLNLTRDEGLADFLGHYFEAADWLRPMLETFGPEAVKSWAEGLGQDLFTGSTGRVFPRRMKASPLLRAWLARLDRLGVERRTRWRWQGWREGALAFDTPEGLRRLEPGATVLALGGASWGRLGSDGAWADILGTAGVALAPFQPANFGLSVMWSPHMARHFGTPVKAAALIAGGARERGEFVISARGLEGGGIYAVSRAVRLGARLRIDLVPDLGAKEVADRLARPLGKESLANVLRKRFRLDPARLALLQEFARPLPRDAEALATLLKDLEVRHDGARPPDEAISTAGGVPRAALDDDLMLKDLPGVFCAGEMLDWEAPTGGYLLTACLATGHHAGKGASRWMTRQTSRARL